jgi:DNA modification methylase
VQVLGVRSQAVILLGDCRESLAGLPERSVQTCVTSPPYFGLRDYGHDGQIGLEPTPDEFVAALVEVFREVRRVLRDDGTVWLNLGDTYNAYNGNRGDAKQLNGLADQQRNRISGGSGLTVPTLKQKDLIGVPWMVAFALRADGWYLRSDIIWNKPNPMPESVTDRPTKAHEYLFLLSKGPRYFYDADAIREADQGTDHAHRNVLNGQPSLEPSNGLRSVNGGLRTVDGRNGSGRNKRSVWTVATQPYAGAHFATFPAKLIEPCILAGSRPGDTVLDPFAGSGTTGVVCGWHGREFVGCELNPEYAAMAEQRIAAQGHPAFLHAKKMKKPKRPRQGQGSLL